MFEHVAPRAAASLRKSLDGAGAAIRDRAVALVGVCDQFEEGLLAEGFLVVVVAEPAAVGEDVDRRWYVAATDVSVDVGDQADRFQFTAGACAVQPVDDGVALVAFGVFGWQADAVADFRVVGLADKSFVLDVCRGIFRERIEEPPASHLDLCCRLPAVDRCPSSPNQPPPTEL